jgi:hypothetical protein
MGLPSGTRPALAAYDVGVEAAMDVWSKVLVWWAGFMLRRENQRRRAVLRRELSAYSPVELIDLEAAIERYPLGQTRELRSMLVSQRLREAWSRPPRAA